MSKNKKEIPFWAKIGHSKPVTRREMLGCGMIPFAASLLIPNWLSMFYSVQAQGAEALVCPPPKSSGMIPFITVNLQGGAGLSSNYLPLNEARDLLPSYTNLGLGDNKLPIEREFGNVPFGGMHNGALLSQILAGIRTGASRATLDRTAFIAIPCLSLSDSGRNLFDVSGLVTKAGLLGSHLPNLGTGGGRTGISQLPARVPPPSPLSVSGFGAVAKSVAYSNVPLSANQRNSLAKLMRNLNSAQVRQLGSIQGAEDMKKVLECAGVRNVDNIASGTDFLNPRTNADLTKIWSLAENTSDKSEDMIFATMVYCSLMGFAGSSNIQLGGYDYHDNTRTTGNALDHRAGLVMGKILESAHVLKKPTFLYVTTDGSVSASGGAEDPRQPAWGSDRNSGGIAYFMYYDPKGRPQTSDFQIGHYNAAQAADRFYVTGGNSEAAAAAVFANWCAANKRNDLYIPTAGDRVLDAAQLKQIIKLA